MKLQRLLLCFFISCTINFIIFLFLYPLFSSETVIIRYTLSPFDICKESPYFWNLLKLLYLFFSFFSIFILSFSLLKHISPFQNTPPISSIHAPEGLHLLLGKDSQTNLPIYLPESSLYQNIFITGSIGSGKTSSSMYPFTEQLISYESSSPNKKLGMLILDTKGNFYSQVKNYVNKYNRQKDLIILGLSSPCTYNPLDKPNLKPIVLANRLKTILTLFSPNNSESYWLDKVEQILSEAIKLCRFYNHNYVTFTEIHKLITNYEYFSQKVTLLRDRFQKNEFNSAHLYDLLTCIQFFENEFFHLDERTHSILKSEITRITNLFISDYSISKHFCPSPTEISFHGFKEVIENGKIVVLSMNIFEYKNLSKLIATYLKLDFQSEIMQKLAHHAVVRPACFICDEYHEYATTTDSDFLSQSREAKCINILSTQSYTSLLNALHDENTTKVILQNALNKLWYRTDDLFTIESSQKILGKEEKEKFSKTISENAKETSYNYLTNSLNSKNSSLSESINKYYQNDFLYDTNFFTQELETFSCLAFLSNGTQMKKPFKLQMIPYFKKEN